MRVYIDICLFLVLAFSGVQNAEAGPVTKKLEQLEKGTVALANVLQAFVEVSNALLSIDDRVGLCAERYEMCVVRGGSSESCHKEEAACLEKVYTDYADQ